MAILRFGMVFCLVLSGGTSAFSQQYEPRPPKGSSTKIADLAIECAGLKVSVQASLSSSDRGCTYYYKDGRPPDVFRGSQAGCAPGFAVDYRTETRVFHKWISVKAVSNDAVNCILEQRKAVCDVLSDQSVAGLLKEMGYKEVRISLLDNASKGVKDDSLKFGPDGSSRPALKLQIVRNSVKECFSTRSEDLLQQISLWAQAQVTRTIAGDKPPVGDMISRRSQKSLQTDLAGDGATKGQTAVAPKAN
jgi:hypothetical protein